MCESVQKMVWELDGIDQKGVEYLGKQNDQMYRF